MPPVALNFTLVQSVNMIFPSQIAPNPIPSINVLQRSGLSGNVTRNGDFLITEVTTATVSGISGTVTFTYTLQGSFSLTGWTGTYRFRAVFSGGFCDYVAPFSGARLSPVPLGIALYSAARPDVQGVLPTDALAAMLAGP